MNKDSHLNHLAAALKFLLLLASTAFAQSPETGAISGVVHDPANRVVANAEVWPSIRLPTLRGLSHRQLRAYFAYSYCRPESMR